MCLAPVLLSCSVHLEIGFSRCLGRPLGAQCRRRNGMDPLARTTPDAEGFVSIDSAVLLHYELYRPPGTSGSSNGSSCASSKLHRDLNRSINTGGSPNGSCSSRGKAPLLILMGAFGTKAHFATTARFLADETGHEVCIFDHRGVGKSCAPRLEPQTAAQLAADALVVADTLWGAHQAIHVYGASMGGMVAQELALLLIPARRLLSLGLAITCRGMKPLYGLLGPIFMPKVIKSFLQLWFADSRPKLVRRLMRLLLTRQLMESVHPCGQTYEQVYFQEWLAGFDELWTFSDHTAGACHAHVVLHQYTPDAQLRVIRDCGVPILCQVATRDNLIPAAMQFELADILKARTVAFPTGHMGLLPWKDRFHNMLVEHLAMGEAIRGINDAEHARRMAPAAVAPAAVVPYTAKAAAAVAASIATESQQAVGTLNKPLLSAFSNSSAAGQQYIGTAMLDATASSSLTATSSSQDSVDLADLEGQQSADAPDLSIDLDGGAGAGDGDGGAAHCGKNMAGEATYEATTDVAQTSDWQIVA